MSVNPSDVVHMQQINGFMLSIPTRIYIERSLLVGGTVVVTQDTNLETLPWLQETGLAPAEVVTVPNRCMFAGIEADTKLLADLKQRLADGAKLQFFRPTRLEEKFIAMLGLTWDKTLSCNPDVAEIFANKSLLRRLAVTMGFGHAFLPHRLLAKDWNIEILESAVREIGDEARKLGYRDVLVKRVDLAGGDGFCLWSTGGGRTFAEKHGQRELLVEVAMWPHVPISIQWMIADSAVTYVGVSLKLQSGFVHKGDVVAWKDAMLDEKSAERLRKLTRPFAEEARDQGYNGILGFDAVWDESRDSMYLVEANARFASSAYPFAVGARLGFTPWAVANKIIEPAKWFETFNGIRGALGSLLYKPERQRGIVPYMLSGLNLDRNRCLGLMAIDAGTFSAERLLRDAEKRLTEL